MSGNNGGSPDETPVGDMTGEGQTEVGPYPSLTDIENMEQADLESVAKKPEKPSDKDS
ncbi:hypothetical protein [Lacisediminihabitans profunda]|uniref:hypothetical protein n=1 Tax=Lacisediminihabitans profunda TaxID=2594790 RepID=UPI00164F4E9C|nr:hypothetical protein [Lacisediminihabitans profunda]